MTATNFLSEAKEKRELTMLKKSGSEAKHEIIRNAGYCYCCRSQVVFECIHSWVRDHYVCTSCHSVPRERHLQMVLDVFFPGWENSAVHESSPSNDRLGQYCTDYSFSQFFNDAPLGSVKDGVLCQNLEALTFPDESFDIFVTKDVFEHVVDPEAAAREINRVLKKNGAHVFTTPKYDFLMESFPRVARVNGNVVHLLPESFHGNPIGDGRSLVTWDYGKDFEQLYSQWCDCLVTTYLTRDRGLGLDGKNLEVFVARKRD